jgi:hypothetical protein
VSDVDACGGLAGGADGRAGGLTNGVDGRTHDLAGGVDGRGYSLEGRDGESQRDGERYFFIAYGRSIDL